MISRSLGAVRLPKLFAEAAVFWLNAALNRVSWRTRVSSDFLVKLLSVEGYHCYLPVKQKLVVTCSSKPYINGYVLFAQNFIAICRLYKSSWSSALWGRGFIAIYLSMDDSWSTACQNGFHGQLLLKFELVHGLPPARRTTSTTMHWGKNSFLWVSAPLCQSARGGRADRVSPKTIGAMGLCLPQSEKDTRPRGA